MEVLGATSGIQYLTEPDLKRQPSLKDRAIRKTLEPIVIEEDEEQDEVDRIYREISELTDSLAGLGLEPALALSNDIKSTLKKRHPRGNGSQLNQTPPIRISVESESSSSEEPITPTDGALTVRTRSTRVSHKKSNSWPLTDAIMEGLSKNSGSSLRRELSIRNPERTLSVSTWPMRHRRSSSIISNISLMEPSPYPAPLRPLPPIPPRRSSYSYASVRRFSQRLTPTGSIDFSSLSGNSSTSSLPGSPSLPSLRSSTQSYIISSVQSSTQPLTPPALPSPTRSTDSPTLSPEPSPIKLTFNPQTESSSTRHSTGSTKQLPAPGSTPQPSTGSTVQLPTSGSTTKLAATPSSTNLSTHSSTDLTFILPEPPQRPPRPDVGLDLTVHVIHQSKLSFQEKRKSSAISFIDVSKSGTTIATKQGKNVIRFWSLAKESVSATIKIASSIEVSAKSREYLARSHVVISDKEKLAAVATRFGRTVEIWNWASQKKLQSIDHADRWAANRFESFDDGWSPLAIYKESDSVIDLYGAVGNKKKPFAKVRIIDLRRAGLPFLPGYPEITLSTTQPLLVAAAGGRVPKPGFPPPERETMLVAWDISDYREVSNTPHLIVRPWLHEQLDMATPCALETHGTIVVSIWIPPSHRVYNELNTETGEIEWKLTPAAVALRHILVWDMTDNTTKTYDIPNTTSCISPDCRFIAYSVCSDERSKLVLLNASTGEEVWCADGIGVLRGLGQGLGQSCDLSKITALSFSSDGRLLMVADSDGNTDVYNVLETVAGWVEGIPE